MRIVLVLALVSCGGSSTVCGPGSASSTGLTADGSGIAFTYMGNYEAAYDDCTPMGSAVSSVTINLAQVTGGGFVELCIPQPQLLGTDLTINKAMAGNEPPAILDSFSGTTADGCIYDLDTTAAITGTLHATGVCDDGGGHQGFALIVDAMVTMAGTGSSTCVASTAVAVSGTVAVPWTSMPDPTD